MAEGYDVELLVEPGVASAGEYTWDTNSERYVIDSESVQRVSQMIDATGIRGTRTRHYGRVVAGNYTVGGSIVMRPGQTQINTWLPRILYGTLGAGALDADQIALGEAPTNPTHYFGVLINKVGDIHEFQDCIVNRCIFSASAGEALTMTLEIVGKVEKVDSTTGVPTATWPGSPPAQFTYAANSLPILMSSGGLTLGGNVYTFEDFEVVIDNMIEPQFRNSRTAQALVPQDRLVTLRVNIDYNAANVLYGAETAIAGTLVFVPATGKNFTFNFPKLIAPRETPPVTGKSAIMRNITFRAYGDDYTDETDYELYIENDLT